MARAAALARLGRRLAPARWSLRLRLVVGVALLVAVGLAVTGTLGVTLLRSYLVAQVDQQLAGVADRPAGGPGGTFPRGAGNNQPQTGGQSDQNLPTPFVFTVLDRTGAVVSQVGGATAAGGPRPELTGLTSTRVTATHGHPFSVPSTSGGSGFRVVAIGNTDGTTTVVGLSLRSSDATVRRLELITVIVAVIVLVLLLALATALVGLGLRPLRTVEQTAERISGGDLSGRMPAPPPNTEVGRLAATINTMLDQIESAFADRERSETTLRQFIADASHELRTPLTTVRGYAELVNRGAFADEDERRHALARIEAEAARMGTLVDELLLLAYLDQQRPLHTVRTDLTALVADAVADARARAPQRSIDYIGPDRETPVEVDADRMREVLGNLLSNALVHTPPEAGVRVGLATSGPNAVVHVADDGPGVTDEARARLFERFYRADPGRSRTRGGTGLGLSIVAAVVAASRGTVTCTSEPGTGTTFTVTLPLAP